jgi:hypothetical protein
MAPAAQSAKITVFICFRKQKGGEEIDMENLGWGGRQTVSLKANFDERFHRTTTSAICLVLPFMSRKHYFPSSLFVDTTYLYF